MSAEGGQIANCLPATQYKCHATDNFIREIGGGTIVLPTASEQTEHSALRIIPSESPDIASCLRARSSLNATDNSIIEHEKDCDADEPNA